VLLCELVSYVLHMHIHVEVITWTTRSSVTIDSGISLRITFNATATVCVFWQKKSLNSGSRIEFPFYTLLSYFVTSRELRHSLVVGHAVALPAGQGSILV
jgi:hypothetical protein